MNKMDLCPLNINFNLSYILHIGSFGDSSGIELFVSGFPGVR